MYQTWSGPSVLTNRRTSEGGRLQVAVHLVDLLLAGSAVATIVLGFQRWLVEPPVFHPVAIVGLLSVPILIRLSVSDARDGYARHFGLAPAVLFASSLSDYGHILPLWGVLVLLSALLFNGGLEALPRASIMVLSGAVLVAVGPLGDFDIRPYDRVVVGLAAYVVTLVALTELRGMVMDSRPRARLGENWRECVAAILALVFASMLFGVLRILYATPDRTSMTAATLLFLGLLLIALTAVLRLDDSNLGTRVLREASTAMPWPAEEIRSQLLEWVTRAVRAESASIELVPGRAKDISVSTGDHTWIVVRRRAGDLAFSAHQHGIVRALAAMASASAEHARREERLKHLVATDALTGLWAYPHFLDLFTTMSSQRQPGEQLGVLFLDLDGFKEVNQAFGHLDADQVLREVGARLSERLPETALCTRYGGDEFVIVVGQVEDQEHLDRFCAQIAAMIAEPIPLAGQLLQLGVTIGSSISTARGDDPSTLVRLANADMRMGKTASQTQQRRSPQWANELSVLRKLIDGGRIQVAYQPIVDLRHGVLHGFEALIRADEQEFGRLSPLLVVRAAERVRLLDEMTAAVADRAIQAMERATDAVGHPMTLSLNVEFAQFTLDNPFLDALTDRLNGTEVGLTLEISERSAVRWDAGHSELAQRLADQGITLAVDDFGAGYATYSLLHAWEWDWVKFDRSLVSGRHPERARILLSHVSGLMRDLGLRAVAEGIETPEQFRLVGELEITHGQGMYLGRPVGEEEMLADLTAHGGERSHWQV